MVSECINIRQVPWEVLKTAAFGLGVQHLPRDLANVNELKTMFDPYSINERKVSIWFTVYYSRFRIQDIIQNTTCSVWFIIQGIIQNMNCRFWFIIQGIIKNRPGYYSAYGSRFRVLFKTRPAASGSGVSVLFKIRAAAPGSLFRVLFKNGQDIIQRMV